MSQIFSLFDKKSVSFSNPFFSPSIAEATRAVQMACRDGKAMFANYPADYALYLVAHWDHTTGALTPTSHGGPQLVLEVAALVQDLPTPRKESINAAIQA